MNYCDVDDQVKQHLSNLINWIIDEVMSAGGDGDALWYSEYFHIDDLYPLLEETNKELKWNLVKHEDCISIGQGQAGVLITNNQKHWDEAPDWQQVMIRY